MNCQQMSEISRNEHLKDPLITYANFGFSHFQVIFACKQKRNSQQNIGIYYGL